MGSKCGSCSASSPSASSPSALPAAGLAALPNTGAPAPAKEKLPSDFAAEPKMLDVLPATDPKVGRSFDPKSEPSPTGWSLLAGVVAAAPNAQPPDLEALALAARAPNSPSFLVPKGVAFDPDAGLSDDVMGVVLAAAPNNEVALGPALSLLEAPNSEVFGVPVTKINNTVQA